MKPRTGPPRIVAKQCTRLAGRRLMVETFEPRLLLSVFRTMDGTGNNPQHPDWGAGNSQLLRLVEADYADGVSAPAGEYRLSPREISNLVIDQTSSTLNSRQLTDFVWAWGQFVDHDIDLSEAASPAEPFNIPVPTGDAYFDPLGTGTAEIPLSRSVYDPATGTTTPRQQLNQITAYIDGSNVYGSDVARATALRTFYAGRLRTSDGDLLPYNTLGLPNAPAPAPEFFLAGDVRANENIVLTSLHTIFMREHNRLATEFSAQEFAGADLSDPAVDEEIYQRARQLVGAQMQAITYNEFLPALLGPYALDTYAGYDSAVPPQISNLFSTAIYRVGHTMLSPDLQRLDSSWNPIPEGPIELRDAFFNPAALVATGVDPLLRGAAEQRMQEIDSQLVDDVRNFLFGPPGSGGFDLASLNIQRGRDHGLPDYNQVRQQLGLVPVQQFSQITSDPHLADLLETAYGSVHDIDVWVGALAEDHLPGSSVGELITHVMVDQFHRLRAGDSYWFEKALSPSQVQEINNTKLSDIVQRNTGIDDLRENVFVLDEVLYYRAPAGTVNARLVVHQQNELLVIEDALGNVLASAPVASTSQLMVGGPIDSVSQPFSIEVHTGGISGSVEVTVLGGTRTDRDLRILATSVGDQITVDGQHLISNGKSVYFGQMDTLSIYAGEGDDRVEIVNNSPAKERLFGEDGDDTLIGGGGGDLLSGNSGRDTLLGGGGHDNLFGGGGRDELFGEDGNDYLAGGDDNDMLSGNAGDDTLRGDAGRDNLYGGQGDDTLLGGEGGDRLFGNQGRDLLNGEDQDDTLYGDDGNDSLIGDDGHDSLYGGPGKDWLSGNRGNDILDGGEQVDKMYGGKDHDILIGGSGSDRMYGHDGQDLLVGDAGHDQMDGGLGDDYLFGSAGNDLLNGQPGHDVLIGGSGNDLLKGGADDDWLFGESGDDTLWGYSGNDVLVGGPGNDVYDGGAGQDRLIDETGFLAASEVQQLPRQVLDALYASWLLWEFHPYVVAHPIAGLELPDTVILEQLAGP